MEISCCLLILFLVSKIHYFCQSNSFEIGILYFIVKYLLSVYYIDESIKKELWIRSFKHKLLNFLSVSSMIFIENLTDFGCLKSFFCEIM